ncbi:MAG TPA: cupin domain-containing protein [Myxococcota bacterium]
MRRNTVNIDEVAPSETQKGRHRWLRRMLGDAAGGRQIGCSHMIVPPGAVSFPFHAHAANEEALFVLSGRGTLRLGSERIAVRPGDWVALPVGPEHAHQLVNDGDAPLEYLCISTLLPVDVWTYPDSGKIGFCAARPGGGRADRYLVKYVRAGSEVDYWDGEPLASEEPPTSNTA